MGLNKRERNILFGSRELLMLMRRRNVLNREGFQAQGVVGETISVNSFFFL